MTKLFASYCLLRPRLPKTVEKIASSELKKFNADWFDQILLKYRSEEANRSLLSEFEVKERTEEKNENKTSNSIFSDKILKSKDMLSKWSGEYESLKPNFEIPEHQLYDIEYEIFLEKSSKPGKWFAPRVEIDQNRDIHTSLKELYEKISQTTQKHVPIEKHRILSYYEGSFSTESGEWIRVEDLRKNAKDSYSR